MGKPSRQKGVRGELEIIKIFNDELGLDLRRNSQAQYEGKDADLYVYHFAIEVKRQETLSLRTWWKQICESRDPDKAPCLIYRQNNQPWRVVVPSSLITPLLLAEDGIIHDYDIEDYERTVTVFLPLFIEFVREMISAEAIETMAQHNAKKGITYN